jgi:hypothetical protein
VPYLEQVYALSGNALGAWDCREKTVRSLRAERAVTASRAHGERLVVQHIEAIFASALVDSLAPHTELAVYAAEEGMMPKPGAVLLRRAK